MDAYRKELKFIVGDDVFADVRNRISGIMRPDEHQTGDFYRIRSVYFDSPSLTCYRENLAGVSPREKYRIRTYDCDESVIMAEIKVRYRDTISKMSTPVDKWLFDVLISGDAGRIYDELSGSIKRASASPAGARKVRTLEKYLVRLSAESFAPAVIVDYERTAYVYDIANVRITFDRNVASSREFDRMFDEKLTGRPAISGNMHILEIKFDEFLPGEIKEALGELRLERTNSSKYAFCMANYV